MKKITVFNQDCGTLGEPTPMVDKNGSPLHVGDLVIFNYHGKTQVELVLKDGKYFVSGLGGIAYSTPTDCVSPATGTSFPITLLSKYTERRDGEVWSYREHVQGNIKFVEV